MTQIRALLDTATTQLAESGVVSPERDAAVLLAHAWRRTPADLQRARVMGEEPDPTVVEHFEALVHERATRVPVQHLTGWAPFRHIELAVGPGVFVPRPETELLVDVVLVELQQLRERGVTGPTVVDLCTGSGALALAVKDEFPAARVHAVEVDPLAHAWATQNRDRLGADVEIVCGDARTAFAELLETVDVVVSNPPYIPVGMVPIDPEVRDHDPDIALYGGSSDGLRIPLDVAARAAQLLAPGGLMVMEHADTQGDSLPAALQGTGSWSDVVDQHDLTGRPRATCARRA